MERSLLEPVKSMGLVADRAPRAVRHLVERVLPRAPIRHWICSLPWGLRALLGYDRELCAEVASAFVGELCGSLQRGAKRALALARVAVCAVQRTDSALRLTVHFHVLALDGDHVRPTHRV